MASTRSPRATILLSSFLFTLLVTCAMLICAAPAWAADPAAKVGDVEYDTLQEAIDAAQEGDAVTLLRDLNEVATISGKSFTLDLANHTISGEGINTYYGEDDTDGTTLLVIVDDSNVVVKNGIIRDGTGDAYANSETNNAGAICVRNSTLSVNNVTFLDNKEVSSYGNTAADIRATDSVLTITDCVFDTDQVADQKHHAIAGFKSDVSISNTKVSNRGAALYVRDAPNPVTVTDTQFLNNSSSFNSLIDIEMNDVAYRFTMDNCIIKNNSFSRNFEHMILLTQNKYAWSYVTFNNCTITDNTSEQGKLFASSGRYPYSYLTLNDTLVANNTTQDGALEIHNYMKLILKNSVVKDNVATGRKGFDTCAGGIVLYSTQSNGVTMENSAIYNNVLQSVDAGALGVANDLYVYKGVKSLSGFQAANKMYDFTDPDYDFSNLVWKDGKTTGFYDKIPEITDKRDCYYTVMSVDALQVAQINDDPDKIYETLEAAFENAEEGDTVKLIAKEQNVEVSNTIAIDKQLVFDANDHNVQFAGLGKTLFTVKDGGSLTMKNTQSEDPDNKNDGGIEKGGILIEEGGSVSIEDTMLTDGVVNNGNLVLNAMLKTLSVELGAGKVIQLGSAYDSATSTSTSINVTLSDGVKSSLNDGTASVVRVVEGGNSDLEKAVKVAGITNGAVVKEYVDEGIQLRILKAIYLSGSGDNDNNGASAETAVLTFEEAKARLGANPDIEAIIISGTVPVVDSQIWSLPEGKKIIRDATFTGALVQVKDRGVLTLKDIVLDGRNIDASGALVKVDVGGTLNIQDGALLANNAHTSGSFFERLGGAVYSEGDTNMTGGTIDGNSAAYGGGIAQYGGTFTMTGGVIKNNMARPTGTYRGAGGGVFLIAGANMTLGSADSNSNEPVISNNYTRGPGGGIAIGAEEYPGRNWFLTYKDGEYASLGTSLSMHGGIIDGNTAAGNGGGIFVQDSTLAHIYAGAITNNTAYGNNGYFAGGGIYVNGIHTVEDPETHIRYHEGPGTIEAEEGFEHGFLYLENVEITNNTAAWLGGAFAACYVSKTIVGDFSTAIHDNKIENTATMSLAKTPGANVDVFLSTIGHGAGNAVRTHPLAYLSNYMIDGGDYKWTYPLGDPASTDSLYENRSPMQVVTAAETSSDDMKAAMRGAKVLISGNYGGTNAGGVGSDGIIVFGSIVEKVDVSVAKAWGGSIDEAKMPTSLKYNLYRAKGEDGEKALYKEVVVRIENENGKTVTYAYPCKDGVPTGTKTKVADEATYNYTWKDLLKYVPGTNDKVEYVYTVEEDLDHEAQNASGDVVDLQVVFASQVTRIEDDKRDITRPQTDGTVAASEQTVQQWNILNAPYDPIYVSIPVQKKVQGKPAQDAELTFALKALPAKDAAGAAMVEGGEPVLSPLPDGAADGRSTLVLKAEASKADQELEGAFSEICFDAAGTYTYEVHEVVPEQKPAGWTFDETVYTVAYTVAAKDGVLSASRTVEAAGEGANAVAFTNAYEHGTVAGAAVSVSKTVTGDADLAGGATFEFAMEALDEGAPLPEPATVAIAGQGTASFGEVAFDTPGTYRYAVREVAPDPEPAGWRYDRTLYLATYEVSDVGGALEAKLSLAVAGQGGADDVAVNGTTAAFANDFRVTPVSAVLPVNKRVAGDGAPQDAAFVFRIRALAEGAPMPAGGNECSVRGAGSAEFGAIAFEAPGHYEYEVAEVPTNAAGWAYDASVYTVAYDVSLDGAGLVAVPTVEKDGRPAEGGAVVFENSYEQAPGTADGIVVAKVLDAAVAPAQGQTFAFDLVPASSSNPMPASAQVAVDGAGTAAFGTITFDAPGTYEYMVVEAAPDPVPDGYAYDHSVYTVRYEVEEQEGEPAEDGTRTSRLAVARTEVLKDAIPAEGVVFTNSFDVTPALSVVKVTKETEGADPEEAPTFRFVLAPEDEGGPMPDGTRDGVAVLELQGAGTVASGAIQFDEPGTYAYTLAEAKGESALVAYDDAVYRVVFEVTERDGQLYAAQDVTKAGLPVDAAVFANAYLQPEPVPEPVDEPAPRPEPAAEPEPEPEPAPQPEPTAPVDVVLVKYLADALIHAEEFSFGLYDADGKLLDTVHTTLGAHVDTEGYTSSVQIAFRDLVFSQPGTYRYTIREHVEGTVEVVAGDENNLKGFEPGFYKGGVRYDDRTYEVVVTVTERDGQLHAAVAYPGSADGVHLYNEYSEEYVEIDGFDSHPNDGLHAEPEPEPEPQPAPAPAPEPEPEPSAEQEDGGTDAPKAPEAPVAAERQPGPAAPRTVAGASAGAPRPTPVQTRTVAGQAVATGDEAPAAALALAGMCAAAACAFAAARLRRMRKS